MAGRIEQLEESGVLVLDLLERFRLDELGIRQAALHVKLRFNQVLPGLTCQQRVFLGSFGILVNRTPPYPAINLARNKSNLARPYICLFTHFSRFMCPSVGPFEKSHLSAALTAA